MPYPTKVKIEVGQQLTLTVQKAEQYIAKDKPYIALADAHVEFSASAPALAKQIARYFPNDVPTGPGPIPVLHGHTWRITRKALAGTAHGVLDVDMIGPDGLDITPSEWRARPSTAPVERQAPDEEDDFADFLDEPPPGEYEPVAPRPAAAAAPRPVVVTGGTPVAAQPVPVPVPVAKASPAAVDAAMQQVKAALAPNLLIERRKIGDVYREAMLEAKGLHDSVSGGGTEYAYDGSAINATAYTIFKLWETAGLTK